MSLSWLADPGVKVHRRAWVIHPIRLPRKNPLGGAIYAGWNGVDEFGRKLEHGRYVGGAVATREDLLKYSPPLILDQRYNRQQMEDWKKNYSDHAFALFSHSGPLGLTIEAFGLVEFCYALFDKRPIIQESVELKTEWFIETSKYAVEMGVDFVVMGDDMGFKDHGYVSPSDFKELAFPYYRKIVDSLSVPVFSHSEGYIRDYIPMAVEAGIKGIHGLEPGAGMNMAEIKREFGKDLVLREMSMEMRFCASPNWRWCEEGLIDVSKKA